MISAEKAKADAALMEALPALEAAAAALENLKKDDITELKSFAKPPALVQAVCLQVIILRPTGGKSTRRGATRRRCSRTRGCSILLKSTRRTRSPRR